ncbi:MAG: YraN family protein [Lachnospiraceae bacterium]|nr:YraN family protein [Lachnospiraceae bacterium]
MNDRELGTKYEEVAVSFLERHGVRIIEKNYRTRQGEIDLIGLDRNKILVFIEVKYRKNEAAGLPEEAVQYRKQQTICHVSDIYRMKHGIPERQQIRYDVVAILANKIKWYPGAFEYFSKQKKYWR